MPCAEIIAIGTELLLGEIIDINTASIAKVLNKIGIDIYHTSIVGDNQSRITDQIKLSLKRADIVITTGGLGPTIDDPTRQAIADAYSKELIFHTNLWEQIKSRFKSFNRIPTSNNKKQAFIPENASPIENPIGTAPAFYIFEKNKTLICLPGVPAEMELLLKDKIIHLLKEIYNLKSTTISRIIHTAGVGESRIDNLISDFEKLDNPSVGITAKPGQVDIRITVKAGNLSLARNLIAPIEKKIVEKLGDSVYGYDQETLYSVVTHLVESDNLQIIFFHDIENEEINSNIIKWQIINEIRSIPGMNLEEIESYYSLYNKFTYPLMGIFLKECLDIRQSFKLIIYYENNIYEKELRFGGHPVLLNSWIENNILNSIREMLTQKR